MPQIITKTSKLTERQKAAILLVSVNPDVSAEVLRKMDEKQLEQITLDIASLGKVPSEIVDMVVEEFFEMCLAQEYIAQGGIEYAKKILERALGNTRAMDIINRLSASLQVTPFEFIWRADPSEILNLIQNEHPQTIAIILAHLPSDKSAQILSALPQDLQADVARRVATTDRTTPEVIREIEKVLERRISSIAGEQEFAHVGGVQSVVEMLNRVDRGTEKTILETLEEENPELAEEIKRRMFVFEDIISLDDRGIQRILREVDSKGLALALKTASEELSQKMFRNMSERAAMILKEDLDFIGPVRLRDVEVAQQSIVNIVRRLEEDGEIVVSRGGDDELVV